MAVLERDGLVARSAELGQGALHRLRKALTARAHVTDVRGLGLMLGIEFASGHHCAAAVARCLENGIIVLPSGPGGCVLSITPPLSIDPPALTHALDVVIEASMQTGTPA